jgi:hypothetical protein
MPIEGLTNEPIRVGRAGKIRLGEKRKSERGTEYPAKLDYFLFDPVDESLVPMCQKLYGEKPRKLNIVFISDDPEEVFPQYYKCYSASGLLCKGTGVRAVRLIQKTVKDAKGKDVIESEMQEMDCPTPDECDFAIARGSGGKPGCKRVASLQFMLPDWPTLEVWQINSGGIHTIRNINSTLEMLRRMRGTIMGIPLELHLVQEEGKDPAGKAVKIYALKIVIPHSLIEMRHVPSMLGYAGPISVPKPSDEMPDDLYPQSQINPGAARMPAPTSIDALADSLTPEETAPIPDTPPDADGEIPEPEPEKPAPFNYAADPECKALVKFAQLTDAQAAQWYARAAANPEMTQEKFCEALKNHAKKQKPATDKPQGNALF